MLIYFESLAEQFPENPRVRAHIETLGKPTIQSYTDDLTISERMERAATAGN
jgi:hypothetical protein